MTFYPEKGTYSRDEFDSAEGALFSNSGAQGIVGGYVTLKSLRTGTSSLVTSWNPIYNWSLENNLYNIPSITGDFTLLTGEITAETNTVSGSYGIAPSSSAWFVDTSLPTYETGYGGFSGRGDFGLALYGTSPNTLIKDAYDGTAQEITFEFDVSAVEAYSGLTELQGFNATGNNLTGLPALTGIVGHGLLFCDGNKWDYIEVTPFGIRSLNHPEIAIPIDLLNPRKIRVGFRGSDVILATEDGRSVVGSNKFTTAPDSPPMDAFAYFGAPTAYGTVNYPESIMTGVDATYGKTLWDNIKILTGEMAIFESTGVTDLYSTGLVTMYTDSFDPEIYINKYLYATIGYAPFQGGVTTVNSQYSGAAGWTTYSSETIPLTGNTVVMDLTSMPVFSYPREDGGTDYLQNPIRFKIDQLSTLGDQLPPAIEFIELHADKSSYEIDMLPDWKLVNETVDVQFYVETGTLTKQDPTPELWSTLLYNTPTITGSYTGESLLDESSTIGINVVGTGEVLLQGPYRASFKNYVDVGLSGETGSAAYQYFGSDLVYNFFPNPLFSEGFETIQTGYTNYQTGLTEGEVARDIRLASTYTGTHRITLSKQAVYRPEVQARVSRINSYLGRTSSPQEEYLQSINIPASIHQHNGDVGIEAVIPSGIATGNLQVSFDIEIAKGSGVNVDLVGSSTGSFILPGESFRRYRSVSFPTSTTTNHEFLVRLTAPSGYAGDEYEFNIDNLTVSAYDSSYLSVTGLSAALHQSGISMIDGSSTAHVAAQRAATVFYTEVCLMSYPETTGYIIDLKGSNKLGMSLTVDNEGYVTADIDTASYAIAHDRGEAPFYHAPSAMSMTSLSRLPLGKWTSVGFIHDVKCFDNFSLVSWSGNYNSHENFTATNKAYICFDGYPVAQQDMMTGWKAHVTNSTSYPYASFIELTGDVTATIASGLTCKLDALHITRPPVADVETEMSIKSARVSPPYFVPDSLFKGNAEDTNALYPAPLADSNADLYIGSCYNFSSLGTTNWDRGHIQNHLLYFGDITKQTICPYSGQDLNSVRFQSGAYALAPYSSTYQRLQNTTGQSDIVSSLSGLEQGSFRCLGWIYPRETGSFFTFYEDGNNLTGSRLDLSIDHESNFLLSKYNSNSNSVVYSSTGHEAQLSGWNFVNLNFISTGYNTYLNTGAVAATITDHTGVTNTPIYYTGVDYGIAYQLESTFRLGEGIDCNLFNWAIPTPYSGETDFLRDLGTTGSKSGQHQVLMTAATQFTGNVLYPSYNLGSVVLGPGTSGDKTYFSLALHNTYDVVPRLHGIAAYDDGPFQEVNSYELNYQTDTVAKAFGTTRSPIRLGNQVPETAVNIARISSPAHTVPSSISTIDLSDSNINNLVSYRNGSYDIGGYDTITDSVVTGYQDINTTQYDGRYDVTYSGQVLSADIELSTLAIADLDSNVFDKAYYHYLVGRGQRAVIIQDAFPHLTGQVSEYTTGTAIDNYTANLQRIKNSIKLKDSKGKDIDKALYPYDISISPYSPDDLFLAARSGEDIYLDNIGSDSFSGTFPSRVFSVLLITNKNRLENQSVFVHYDAYDIGSQQEIAGYKEVVNPQPIFREKHPAEEPDIGLYSLDMNATSYYDLTFYGIATGYSGQL